MQKEVLIVERAEQARAIQDGGFLSRFLEPASPSDVARDLGIRANLAHHRAKRYAALGLLFEAKREGGRVYYQLTAKTFKHDRLLLPAGDPDEGTAVSLRQLEQRFLAAYEYCDRHSHGEDPSWHVHSFARQGLPLGEPPKDSSKAPVGTRPPHFQARTFALSPQRYRELVRQIANLLIEAEANDGKGAKPCTMAFLAYDDVLAEGSNDGHYMSSFVPASESGEGPEPWAL